MSKDELLRIEFTIMTINVKNEGKKGSTPTEPRRKHVIDVIRKNESDIVLLQECIKKDFTEIKSNKFEFKLKSGHAGIMTRKKDFITTEVDITGDNLNDLKKLKEAGVKARLSLIKATINGREILIGSWHGPNTGIHEERKMVVKELLQYMRKKACLLYTSPSPRDS